MVFWKPNYCENRTLEAVRRQFGFLKLYCNLKVTNQYHPRAPCLQWPLTPVEAVQMKGRSLAMGHIAHQGHRCVKGGGKETVGGKETLGGGGGGLQWALTPVEAVQMKDHSPATDHLAHKGHRSLRVGQGGGGVLLTFSASYDKSLEIHWLTTPGLCNDSSRCQALSLFARKSYVPWRVVTSFTMRRR